MKIAYLRSKKIKKYFRNSKRNGGAKIDENNKSLENHNCQIVNQSLVNNELNEELKDLTNCDLRDITTIEMTIKNKNFIDVDFSNANLDNIIFENVFFSNCKFIYTQMNNTNLTSCIFKGISSIGIIGNPKLPNDYHMWQGQIIGPYITYNERSNKTSEKYIDDLFTNRFSYLFNYRGINFSNVDFRQFNFPPVRQAYQIYDGANFTGANMSYVSFTGLRLSSVISGNIIGQPGEMPYGYSVVNGYIVGRDVNLINADLSGADLIGINLSDTKLKGVISGNIKGNPELPLGYKIFNGYIVGPDVNLTDANLLGMDLSAMDLSNCVLKGIISGNIIGTPKLPSGYKIIKGYIVGPDVNLTDANLSGANLSELVLNNCTLKGIISGNIIGTPILPTGYKVINGYIIGADVILTGANLSGADLTDIDLTNSILHGLISKSISGEPILPIDYKIIKGYIIGPYVNLIGADLEDVDLTQANLKGIKTGNVQGIPILPNGYHIMNGLILGPDVDLTSANLIDLDLNDVDLTGCILNQIVSMNIRGQPRLPNDYKIFNGYIIGPNVSLQNADLSNIDLKDCLLKGVTSGNIVGHQLILPEDYILENGYIVGPYVDLTNADLTNVDIYKSDLKGVISGNIKGQPRLPIGFKLIKGYIMGPEVNLENVDLSGMELIDINLNNTDLTSCNLNKLITKNILGKPILSKDYIIRYGYIFGPGVDLSGVDLTDLNLGGLNLTNAIFNQTNLDKTTFRNYIKLNIDNEERLKISGYQLSYPEMSGYYYETDEQYNGFPIYKKKESTIYNFIILYQKEFGKEDSRWQIINENEIKDRDLMINTDSGFAYSEFSYDKPIEDHYNWNVYCHSRRNKEYQKLSIKIDINESSNGINNTILKGIISKNIIGTPILPDNYKLIKNCIIGPGVSLKGIDLKNTDLSGFHLDNCDLTNTNLSDAILSNIKSGNIAGIPKNLPENYKIVNGYMLGPDVDLTEVDLSGFTLNDIDLSKSILKNVKSGNIIGNPKLPSGYNLIHGIIFGIDVDLRHADLSGIELYDINLDKIDLSMCNLKGIKSRNIRGTPKLPENYLLLNGYIIGPDVDLTNADLRNINFVGVSIENAILTGIKSVDIIGKPLLPKGYTLLNRNILGPSVDLTGADLRYTDLNNIDLNSSILANVKSKNIQGIPILPQDYKLVNGYIIGPYVNLNSIDLRDIDLTNSNLKGAVFEKSNFTNVNFTNVNLVNTNLNNTSLYDSILDKADLTGANLRDIQSSNISGQPILPQDYKLINKIIIGPYVSLKEANLEGADLRNSNLTGIRSGNITGFPLLSVGYKMVNSTIVGPDINLSNTSLEYFDLSNINFNNSNLSNTDLRNCNFNNVSSGNIIGIPKLSSDYNIINQYIIGPDVNLKNATLQKSQILNANLYNVNLSGANLYGCKLQNVELINADLTGANFTSAILSNIISENIQGIPILPKGYHIINGYIFGNNINIKRPNLEGVDLTKYPINELNLGIIQGQPILPSNYKLINNIIVGPELNLSKFDLSNFDLSNTDLNNTILPELNYLNINLNINDDELQKLLPDTIKYESILGDYYETDEKYNGFPIYKKKINEWRNSIIRYQKETGKEHSRWQIINENDKNSEIYKNDTDEGFAYSYLSKNESIEKHTEWFIYTVDETHKKCRIDIKIKSGNIKSRNIIGKPVLPISYKLIKGYIVGPRVDLSECDLTGADLSNMDLTNVNLSNTNLTDANLSGIKSNNLIGNPILPKGYTIIYGTIVGSNLKIYDLDLSDLDLYNINLINTSLNSVNLSNTVLKDTILKGVGTFNITGEPILPNGYKFLNGHIIGSGVDLQNANLRNIDFKDIDLSDCNLTNADFRDSNLKGVISGNIIINKLEPKLPEGYKLLSGYIVGPSVNLTNAVLTDINLNGILLDQTVLTGADLITASFKGFISTGNIIGEPILPNQYKFIKGYIFGPHIDVSNKDLTDFDLSNIDLRGTNLSGCTLKNVNLTGVNLNDSNLKDIKCGNIIGKPILPTGYSISDDGYIIGDGTGYDIVNKMVIGNGADLTNAVLKDLDLSGYDFTETNLKGADLTNSIFNNQIVKISITDTHGMFFKEISKSTPNHIIMRNYLEQNSAPSPMINEHYTYLNNLYQLRLINIKTYINDYKRTQEWIQNKIYNKIFDAFTNLNSINSLCWFVEEISQKKDYKVIIMVNKQNINGNIWSESKDMIEGDNFFHGFELSKNSSYEILSYNNIKVNLKKGAKFIGMRSGNIIGNPVLPPNCGLQNGYIIGPNVNLTGTDLTNSNLNGLDLSGVDLSSSILKNVKSGSIIGEPRLPYNYHLIQGYIVGPFVNLEGADLTGVDFTNTILNNVTSGNIKGIPKLPAQYSIAQGYIIGPNIKIVLEDEHKQLIIKELSKTADLSLVDIFKMESFQFTYKNFKDIEKELDKAKYKILHDFMKNDKVCSKSFFQTTNRKCRFENGKIIDPKPADYKGGNKKHSIRKIHKRINSKKKFII